MLYFSKIVSILFKLRLQIFLSTPIFHDSMNEKLCLISVHERFFDPRSPLYGGPADLEKNEHRFPKF